nr:uncharacterized protein LOC112012746 [Quercus suber]
MKMKVWKAQFSTPHNFREQPKTQVLWKADSQWRWLEEMKGRGIKDIFKRAIAEKNDVALLAFTAWAVWNRRNQLRLKQLACPLNQIYALSKDRTLEFQNLHPAVGTPQHRNHIRWRPPDQGMYKVNYDGAIFSQQERAGVGVVIRNAEGAVMASLSQQIPLPTTVAQVEALAVRRATEFALELGVTKAIFEGDSEVICRELNDPNPSQALHGHLLQDVKSLSNSFHFASFSHVCRQGNNVADALAKRAIREHDQTVWMEDVPSDIQHVVQADLANFG